MKTARQITHIDNPIRLRVRRVNELAITEEAIHMAKESKRAWVVVNNGGSVANRYGYPADTEGVVAVGFPNGNSWTKVVRLPANKVSSSGVFNEVYGERGLFDRRFSEAKQNQMKKEFLDYVRSELSRIGR
jgi:hypothetical protein